jgi:uncharacterized repeat protein (TIGR03803 family)
MLIYGRDSLCRRGTVIASSGPHRTWIFGVSLRKAAVGPAFAIVCVWGLFVPQPVQAQTYTVIHNFTGGADGNEPNYGLTIDANGDLYGTTFGGDFGTGNVYMLSPGNSGWVLTPLYVFTGGSDGGAPYAAVIFGPDGSLFGTTGFGGIGPCQTGGGKTGCGTVFNLKSQLSDPATSPSSWTENALYDFSGGTDGATPFGGRPIFDKEGNFYGTTFRGGGGSCSGGCGLVYELTPLNGGWKENVLYSFKGGNDGASPWAGVIFDQTGNLYGTTFGGGAYGYGTVYELMPTGAGWVLKTLYSFQNNHQDGGQPYAGLIFDQSGNLYGATTKGGSGDGGTVFEMIPGTGGWTYQTLYAFNGSFSGFAAGPTASLVMDSVGNLYGATAGDGAYRFGAVFKLTPTSSGGWTYTSLHDFTSGTDGRLPRSNLVFDRYGNLFGTAFGGPYSQNCGGPCGLVFEITFPLQYVPVTPCRLVDTRNPDGEFGGPPIQGQTSRSFIIPDNKNCNIPSTAAAYSLNVTVVPQGPLGYLTIWPTGESRPPISTMNSLDGRVKANAAIVEAGYQSAVSVYATNTTDVVIDIDGYFAPTGGSTLAYYPLTPCRVLDTRKPNGDLGGPYLQGGQERDFPVLESNCQIPSSAQAYSMNFTVVPYNGQPLGFLTVWPEGNPRPVVSTLNNLTGTIVANAAIVPAGTGGGIATYPDQNTQLVADIAGYFAPAGQGGLSLYPAVPCRVLDTRKAGGAFSGELTVDVVDSVCAPPNTARAYVFNATVVPQGGLGYLTLWPDGEQQPVVSTLNAIDGAITSNMAIVPNIDGQTDAYASGITQLILDISSYFAP